MKNLTETTVLSTDPQIWIGAMAASTVTLDNAPLIRRRARRALTEQSPKTLNAASEAVRSLIDAIVGIFSYLQPSNIVASALSVDDQNIKIHIASSSPILDENSKKFLTIWDQMVSISRLHTEQQDVQNAVTAWKQAIYEACLPVFLPLLDNRMEHISDWHKRHLKWLEDPNGTPAEMNLGAVYKIISNLALLQDLVRTHETDPRKISQIIIEPMEEIARQKDALGNDESDLGSIEGSVRPWSIIPGRPLFHGIENTSALASHILFLEKFVKSKRMAQLSKHKLYIECQPVGVPRPHPWPSASEWDTLFRQVHKDDRRVWKPDPEYALQFDYLQPSLQVHPELQLASMLAELYQKVAANEVASLGIALPYNYISASQYSCRGCQLWVDEYNRTNPSDPIAIAGISGRWPNDWSLPSFQHELLERRLATNTRKEFISFQAFRNGYRVEEEEEEE